jgi:peptidylprolyl isomerase
MAEKRSVKRGDSIEVNYTGRFQNGQVFDTSIGRSPLAFTVGGGQLIEGFDEAVVGMRVGDKKVVTIPPEKAYGRSGGHPLAGKTLVFEITVVGIR